MPNLDFRIASAERLEGLETHAVRLRLAVTNAIDAEDVQGGHIECDLRVEPALRSYSPAEEMRLVDVFGPRSGWLQALRPRPWARVSAELPMFRGTTTLALTVLCAPGDGDATARYVDVLDGGDIAVRVLYRGRVLYGPKDAPSMAPIAHTTETSFRLPVALFRRRRDEHDGHDGHDGRDGARS